MSPNSESPPSGVFERRRRGLELMKRHGGESSIRLNVLSTFNVDPIPPFLVEAMDRRGLQSTVQLGEFGQISQSLLNPDSDLYRSKPDGIILLLANEDLFAPLYDDPRRLATEEAVRLLDERAAEVRLWMEAVLARLPEAVCLVPTWRPDQLPLEHVLDPGAPDRGQRHLDAWTAVIRELGALSPRVIVVDWAQESSKDAQTAYADPRLWYLGRMRLSPEGLSALSDLLAVHLAAYRNLAKKVVVVDLDDTLWGGIIGEDGLTGLVLGGDGLGLAFADFQRELLKLHDSGTLLAICSKNNPDDAWSVFDQHAGMILRRSHVACARINWEDKAANLREISRELGLALDSFVFLDDNPVERGWIRSALPEVEVPELPKDPAYRPRFLRQLPSFRRIQLTREDLQRADSYRAESLRTQLKGSATSLEDFIASLDQVIRLEPVHAGSLARAAQMCQRTNQFNLTTRRYTVADLEAMGKEPGWEIHTVAVTDRYGDSGITGLGILRLEDEVAHIEVFLLSCRVLGRRVEDALAAFLSDRARRRARKVLRGYYLPTPKNGQVARFYEGLGFAKIEEGVFELDLDLRPLAYPERMRIEIEGNG